MEARFVLCSNINRACHGGEIFALICLMNRILNGREINILVCASTGQADTCASREECGQHTPRYVLTVSAVPRPRPGNSIGPERCEHTTEATHGFGHNSEV
jgi:hypothetical protein